MNLEDCFFLGRIVKTHGFKGDLTFLLEVDDPSQYIGLESVFVEIHQKLVPFFISEFDLRDKGRARVKLEDVTDEASAKALVGKSLYLPSHLLPPLEGDSFYYHEITDYEVHDTNLGFIGTVASVIENGAQDMLDVEHKGQQILIPIVDEMVLGIDRDKRQLKVQTPEGLVDLYLSE